MTTEEGYWKWLTSRYGNFAKSKHSDALAEGFKAGAEWARAEGERVGYAKALKAVSALAEEHLSRTVVSYHGDESKLNRVYDANAAFFVEAVRALESEEK